MEGTGEFEGGSSEFEKLLNESFEEIRPGKIVKGTIAGVNKDFVTVDIGYKSEGIVPVAQFVSIETGKVEAPIGQEVDVLVIAHENDSGQVVISKERADQLRAWKRIDAAFEENDLVKGRVQMKVKGGLQVDVFGIPAFLPGSQIDMRPHKNLDKFIDETFEFRILKITKEKGNIVLSRRAVLEAERDKLKTKTLEVLAEGVVMEGMVKNITDYGAFIDLGGVDGLLHITDISWGRVNHPSDKLSVGQKSPVVVLKYDKENQRVSLGMKQLKEDPWINVTDKYPINSKVTAKVIGLADYGAFVELEEGVEGLIHVSDMSWTKKVKSPSKILSEGEEIEAMVLSIDTEEKKVSLGMKQLVANPWEQLGEKYPIGTHVQGKVRSITDFGIFVGIGDGIDGLVHVSDFSWTKRIKDPKDIHELYKKGDIVDAVVLEIDADSERLSLGIKQLEQDPWENISQKYTIGAKVRGAVTSVKDCGVCVDMESGVEGLIHMSELGNMGGGQGDDDDGEGKKKPFDIGDEVECEVTRIDREERRISLSIKAIQAREDHGGDDFDGGPAVTFGDLIREKMGGGDS